MPSNLKQLDARIKEATVKIRDKHDTLGTGFFVLPHIILTCLHVVQSEKTGKRWDLYLYHDNGTAINDIPEQVQNILPNAEHDIALIILPESLVQPEQPCIYLRDDIQAGDTCLVYGYSENFDNGDVLRAVYTDVVRNEARIAWHKFNYDKVIAGFSGSALINPKYNNAVGVVNSSLGKAGNVGGFAATVASLVALFPFLQQEQDNHEGDAFWQRSKTAIASLTISSEKTIPKRRYIAGTFVEARAFQGRAQRLAKLKHYLIEQHKYTLVQIYAPVGRGKSALAYHFVKQIETSHRDSFTGIVVMSLREATADSFEPSFFALLRQVIPTEKVKPFDAILQQPEQEGSSKVMQIVQHILVDERILVVLDNVEDALDENNHVRSQYTAVLEMLKYSLASQHVHFLLTSRRPLETAIANLGSYSKKVKLYGLEDKESIALIHDLQDDDDDFKLEAVDTLSAILNHDLQGLPLNIVTLASYLKTKGWTLPRYLSQPERLAALKDNASKVLYESRNAEEQRIMQVLAIFQQPVPLQALEYILPEIGELSELCDRLEQHLVVLVAKDELGIPSSYALRPVDGEYVLRQVEDAKALHQQAANYYLQHASEIQDVLDAFNQLMQAAEYEQAAYTLKSVDDELELRGESRLRLELWQQLEDKPLSQKARQRLYHGLATSHYRLGKVREAIAYYQKALAIAREIGDRQDEGTHLGNLGTAYANLGKVQQAIVYFQQVLIISREIGYRRGEGTILGNLGNAYTNLGKVQQAIDYHQQALTISREIGDRHGEGNHLGSLGLAYADLGEVQQAIDYYQQALAISREIGDRRGEGTHLGNLGAAYHRLGEVEQAIDYHQQALTISQEIGDRRGEGADLGNLGLAYVDLGEVEQAIDYYQQALTISQEIGDRCAEGNSLGNLGTAYRNLGEVEQAIKYHHKALTISQEIGNRRGEGADLGNLGLAYADLGEVEQAIDYYQQALTISQEIGDRRGEGNSLANLGQVAESQQNIQSAMAMWLLALTIYMQIQAYTAAQAVFQWLQKSYAYGTDVPAILRELFSENGAVGDRILKEATGIDYRFYREMPASYAEETITLIKKPLIVKILHAISKFFRLKE